MTGFIVLHRDAMVTAISGRVRIPAAEAGPVRDAAGLLAEARRIRKCAAAEAAAATDAARRVGREDGLAEGRATAEAEAGARMFALERRAAEERLAQRERTAGLALAIVRRIAGDLGEGPLVAALAARAAEELLPGTRATVRVPPAALRATRARLVGDVEVVGDPTLGPWDCVIETPLGRTLAGLEVQIGRLERMLATDGQAAAEADRDAA